MKGAVGNPTAVGRVVLPFSNGRKLRASDLSFLKSQVSACSDIVAEVAAKHVHTSPLINTALVLGP